MLKKRLDIENMEIERAQQTKRKSRNKLKKLFTNSCSSKINKIF